MLSASLNKTFFSLSLSPSFLVTVSVVYTFHLNYLQASLNVNEAANAKSLTYVRVRFLFDSDIIYEIVTFGLADNEIKVGSFQLQ